MGMNASAKVAFGINLGEDLPESLRGDDEESFDFEDFVAKEAGLKEPETSNYDDPDWSNYWAAKRKAVADFPVALVRTGSWDYSSWILAVNGTSQEAEWGDAKELKAREITPAETNGLRDFCAKHRIKGTPTWLLAAFYG